jgi:hypothetical protein
MRCVRCSGPIEISQKDCGHCGVPLDADQNGVPDAIEQLLEEKARAIVAADRAREQREQQEQREREERDKLVRELSEARAALETVRRTPRRIWALSANGVVATFFFVLLVGMPFSCIAQGISERSLAGEVLCRWVCEGCSAPARVSGFLQGGRNDYPRTYCTHPSVNVEGGTNEPPYGWTELPFWQEQLFALGLWFLTGLAVLPFGLAWFERKRLARDERRLPAQIAELERTLAATEPPAPAQHYR